MQEESIRDLLRDTATRLFGDLCQPAALRLAETGTWPQTMWAAVEDAGLPRALVPEAAGGHGVGFAEAMVVVRAAGYHALPVPLPETMAAAWLLARAGLPVPDGPLTLASGEDIRISPTAISGHAPRVPWARAPLGIVAIDPAGRVALVPPAACRIESGANVAGEPRDTVHFDGTLTAIGETGLAPSNARAIGATLRAQQIAGAMERITEMTVQYALDRVQFGRPLGKFQAVQQNLAVLAGQTAAAGAAADMAAEGVENGGRILAVAAGKARCGEAAGIGAAIAHQIHGAIGFTHEHSLHFLTKRLWSWRDEFGNETVWNRLLGRHMAKLGPDRYWAELTAA